MEWWIYLKCLCENLIRPTLSSQLTGILIARYVFSTTYLGEKMKSLITLATLLVATSAMAGFTKNYRGSLSEGKRFHCTMTNYSGHDLEVKRVRFYTIRSTGHTDHPTTFTQQVGRTIYSGETMTITLEGTNARFLIGQSCFFVTER